MDWNHTEIDGVPTFWSEYEGDLRAGLVFRVGHADEQLARRGITHLIEHLALYRAVHRPDHVNGTVDATTTTFFTHGTGDEVTAFFAALCRDLRELPIERIPVENQVLRTEADGRTRDLASALAIWRYGAATYGLPGYDELGIGFHTPEQVKAWAAHWFTRGNAVLWLVGGPPPPGLRLDLPAGPRIPVPVPSNALRRTPAYFESELNGVAATSVVPRSTAAKAYSELLRRRLHQSLRVEQGISYSPTTSYDWRDGQHAQISAFADGLATVHSRLVSGFTGMIDRLAEQPATEAEIAAIAELLRAPLRDSAAVAGMTVGAAHAELFGAQQLTGAQAEAEIAALSPAAVQEVAGQARATTLLMVPTDHQPPGKRYESAPTSSTGTVDGEVFNAVPRQRTIGPAAGIGPRLCVGPAGVSLISGPTFVTVKFDQCQVMFAYPDGARHLIGTDALHLLIEPNLWQQGHRLPGLLDQAVHPELVVPRPPRAAEDIPQPAVTSGSWSRLRARLKRA